MVNKLFVNSFLINSHYPVFYGLWSMDYGLWTMDYKTNNPSLHLFYSTTDKSIVMSKLSALVEKKINAPVSKVWQALTDPEQIKQYLFGTNAISDWKKGSSIIYKGEWQGKQYEDKGQIIEIIPDRLLHTTYWSGMSGKEDKPENYANVIYRVAPHGPETTVVSIEQDNIDNDEGVKHMQENWGIVLDSMKKMLESQ